LLFVLKLTKSSFQYKPLLAILNSQLIGWYFRKKFQISDDDTFPQIMIRDILQFPVPDINLKVAQELNLLVDQVIQLNKERTLALLPTKIEQIQRAIDHAERRIDELVYGLYGLAEEEVRVVVGASNCTTE
jgi:adenine-specific DNA-methyltransferase